MTGRRYLRLDLLHQRTKVGLYTRVILQQIRQPGRPLRPQRCPDPLQIRTRGAGELVVSLLQPPLRGLRLVRVAAAQQSTTKE